MAGICRVYCGKLPPMLPTIYSCLWWDNPTSCPNNVGTSNALPRSFPSIYPGNNNGFYIEYPLLFAFPNPLLFAYPNPLLPYFLGILREITWVMHGSAHIIRTRSYRLSHQRQL